jgi:hypothetical protein
MLAGDGACREQYFTGNGRVPSCNLTSSLAVEIEYPLREVVELLTRFSQEYVTTLALEKRRTQAHFERLNPLADRRLRQAESFGGSREAVQLGRLREGCQVGKLQVF